MTGDAHSSATPTETDLRLMALAVAEAEAGYAEGGVPIGSVLARGGAVIGEGRNRRVQRGDPIAHGEMDCLRNAGRQKSYRDTTLYTTLTPCMMCSGAIVQFAIPRVVIGDHTTFSGNEDFLRARGVQVVLTSDPRSRDLMLRFQREHPDIWAEDISVA